MAKRKKQSSTSKKPAKKPVKKKANARSQKGAASEKPSHKRKGGAKRESAAAPDKAASRAGSATLLSPIRTRTKDRSREKSDTAGETVATSDRGIAGIDDVRMINHADRAPGGSCPMQTGEHAPPTNAVQIAGFASEQDDRLEEIAGRLADADKDELLRSALWWAGTARKPRAAIVGRALHELKSFDEEWAFRRGTADKICREIRRHNRLHLRPQIHAQLDSAKDQEKIDSALVGLLNKAWAVLEKLDLLRAAPSAGVYLIGRGLKVFNGFPDWNKPEEPMPKKPTRPPRNPRS